MDVPYRDSLPPALSQNQVSTKAGQVQAAGTDRQIDMRDQRLSTCAVMLGEVAGMTCIRNA